MQRQMLPDEPDAIGADGLVRSPANYMPLNPVLFLEHAARTYPDKTAVIHGKLRFSYRELLERARRLAAALQQRGIAPGDTVAIMAPNVPAMLEAHFGVPMAGAVLNAINTRLDAPAIAFNLRHGGARLLLADTEYGATVSAALAELGRELPVIDIAELSEHPRIGAEEYEALLASADPATLVAPQLDEWQSLSLLYTSGTTGDPKGVVYHARGAYLNALSNAIGSELNARSVYLWTLPMFHCNGWTYPWAVTAVCGTHVCLRKVDPEQIFRLIEEEKVTHMHGAPVVLSMLIHAPQQHKRRFAQTVQIGVGGAAPPSSVIAAMETMGFNVVHLYGTTESYGPATVCAWQAEWAELALAERARQMARQGVPMLAQGSLLVADPATLEPVPQDGQTLGEVMLRGHAIMKGYLNNPAATAKALIGGYYHTGDLAVWHPDGYIEVRDRSKDIIISGGENISSLEIEEVLYRHPSIVEAAVVAVPDEKWGEVPCAFVGLKDGAAPLEETALIDYCLSRLARFKVPRYVIFGPLSKTATGKVQKYRLRQLAAEVVSQRGAS